jgi:membrane-bound lytic murein transglycosylase D
MATNRVTSARLSAALAVAIAIISSGCSQLPSAGEGLPVDAADPDGQLKLDEADIGSSGPAQLEAAIALLDEQSRRALVTELSLAAPAAIANDLFDRIRHGFKIEDVDHPTVDSEESWFARHPAYLDRTFQRGERYLHHIVAEIEARGMPLELALLPIVESAFNPVAYSRARASGLWQFIPATGLRYGLKQNWYYDGRRDVIEATRAALDYLEFLSKEFDGDWLLAIAAYNAGEAAVGRAIAKNRAAGKPTDFFSLSLPRETRAYVPKLLAMRRIVADPGAHGLAFAPIANTPYFTQVSVAGQIDLSVAAELAGISKEELLALNPAFNNWVTDPDGPHTLLVPVEHEDQLLEGLASLPPENRVRVVYHRVRSGETLGAIADKYGISVAALRAANRMRNTVIHPGQDLLIATGPQDAVIAMQVEGRLAATSSSAPRKSAPDKSGSHRVRQGDTLWSIARSYGVTTDSIAYTNGIDPAATMQVGQVLNIPGAARLAATDPVAASPAALTYVVKSGDTISRIAGRFSVSIAQVLGWNRLGVNHVLRPGQRLTLHVGGRRSSGI